jgi:hypothetical protein
MTGQVRTPPSVSQALDNSIAADLKKLWGGRFPTWEEFKDANKAGRVSE